MDDTSCGAECPFVKQGFCSHEKECPNFLETFWLEQNSNRQKLVKDCAPKRLLLNSHDQFNRSISLQASFDKLEDRLAKLEAILEALILQSQNFIVEQRLLLENNPLRGEIK